MTKPAVTRRRFQWIALAAVCGLAMIPASQAAAAPSPVTISPAAPSDTNCYPFGVGSQWNPFAGFVYKNIPPFELRAWDTLAFDLIADNAIAQQLKIEMAPTDSNGGEAPGRPFVTVVGNGQSPSGTGNTTQSDFDLGYRVESQAPFTFAGGGLIIRFSDPSAAYLTDNTCSGVLSGAMSTDPSGFFVTRYSVDADGLPPYEGFSNSESIGGFRIAFADRICRGKAATINGTENSETLTGTPGADVIAAFGGDDRIFGLGGKDLVCAGDGNDKAAGGSGGDDLSGEAGRDKLKGGAGKDKLRGGPEKDILRGGKGRDALKGGAGKDNERQ